MNLNSTLQKAKALEEKGNLKGAHKIYKTITKKYPKEDMGWVCLGALEDEISRQGDGKFGGKDAFAKALSIRIHPSIINDIGNILLRNELRWQEAEMFYREAVIRHGLQNGAQNLAVCLLNTATVKRTPEGWREAWQWYEWRELNALRNHELVWRGEPLQGKRLMVQFEQGFGDHVWGLRFLKYAKEQGATVIALCQPNTIRLAMAQQYIDEVYNIKEDSQIHCDYLTMLLSMPGYMLPNSMPTTEGRYIETGVTPEKRNIPRIGLCWNGSVDKGYQAWRNITLEALKPLIESRPDIEFVSLQKGNHEDDSPEINIDRESIKNCHDLWETACLMDTLDLVISTDTMIPHMGCALGKDTWLLDRWSSCWQFGIGGPETNPHWYETLSIYKQQSFADWTPVLEEIQGKLKIWQPSWM
jgi:hypothetical protein